MVSRAAVQRAMQAPLVALIAALTLALASLSVAACSTPAPDGDLAPPSGAVAERTSTGAASAVTPDIGAPVRGPVVVGALREVESVVVAEAYAQVLVAAGYDVMRQFSFAVPTDATDALLSGHIDVYPERPSVAAYSVLGLPTPDPETGAPSVEDGYGTVADAYALFDVIWLAQAGSESGDGFAPLARAEMLEYFPELATTLDEASARLTDTELARLVTQVETERREPREVVAAFLAATP